MMTKARRDGFYMLLMGTVVFLLLGTSLSTASNSPMQDFRVVYYPARCLLQHGDPYRESEVMRTFLAEGGERPSDNAVTLLTVSRSIYLPTAYFFTVPFAMLPWGPAHILWLILTAGGLILASFLVWNLGANYAPLVCGCLIGFMLANSEVTMILCNAAGIAVSLCVVAVWCFLRNRYIPLGILCLAVSLCLKPQDAGLVWVYFLLAGGVHRKRALQTLLAAVALGLPGVLWMFHAVPNWFAEWHSNVLAFSARGGLTDPGPASGDGFGLNMMLNLQTVFSAFRDDPRIYNPAAYLVCGAPLLVGAIATLRSRPSTRRQWLALAAVAALSMLPVYHRLYDAKLLLLTVPACAMLWAEGGTIAWVAMTVNSAAFVLTGDLPWMALITLIRILHLSMTGLSGQILAVVLVFPTPLVLLATGVFYLWVYTRHGAEEPQAI